MLRSELHRLSYIINHLTKNKEIKYETALEILFLSYEEENKFEKAFEHGWELTNYGPHNKKLEKEIEKHFDIENKNKLLQKDYIIKKPTNKKEVSEKITKKEKELLKDLMENVKTNHKKIETMIQEKKKNENKQERG